MLFEAVIISFMPTFFTNILLPQETSVKDYQNFNFSQPYSQASYYLSLILEEKKWPLVEKLQALSKLESDSLAKFVPHLLSKTYLECYVQGLVNFHVNTLLDVLRTGLNCNPNCA